jgi:diketogulonate reductase-like aldo/keto reductase
LQDSEELWPRDSDGKLQLTDDDYVETWKGMEECVKLGLAKSIGISNFNTQQITRVLGMATIKPAVIQVIFSLALPHLRSEVFTSPEDEKIFSGCHH